MLCATLLKVTIIHGCFSRFLNCANSTKSRKASHIFFCISLSARCQKYLLPILYLCQRQPFRGVLRKRCSENMQQIYTRTPMPKCDFNKVG